VRASGAGELLAEVEAEVDGGGDAASQGCRAVIDDALVADAVA
jgi:hypothetical protein